MSIKYLRATAWTLSLIVSVVAVAAWGQLYSWRLSDLNTYQWFPLFGLLAFSLMWSHYIASILRRYVNIDKTALKNYFEVTSALVLVAILLHPGLLGWQLWRDGLGLPPGSYKAYVGSALYTWVLIGLLAWTTFMAYEFRRKFNTRSWWKLVERANDVAMGLIFFHALKLGSHLQDGWFRYVWYFYGTTFLIALVYIYANLPKAPKSPTAIDSP